MSEHFAVGSVAFAACCAETETNVRETVEEVLRDKRDDAVAAGEHKTARQLNRVLRRPRLFNQVVLKVQSDVVPGFLAAQAAGTVGANGEIIKSILEWFSHEENWQSLLKFITALIALFGGMASFILPFLMLLSFAASASASAQIISQKEYPAYQLVELDVEPTAATYRSVIWQFTPPTISGHQCADGKMLFVAPPGKYSVVASVVAGTKEADKITMVEGDHKLWGTSFTIGPPDSIDDDDTDPPPPDPIVVVENAIVMIVEESAVRSATTAKLLADATFWATVVDRGMRWRVYDIDSPDAASFAAAARAIGLPTLIITDKTGKVLTSTKLPAGKTEIDSVIKKATGK